MYAIRSKKTNRWFQGVNASVGRCSSHHIMFDEEIPTLFKTKDCARIELLSDCLNVNAFDIVEVDLQVKQDVVI